MRRSRSRKGIGGPKTEIGKLIAGRNLKPAPPAPEGNQRARSHGCYAAIAQAELAEETRRVFEALSEDVPVKHDGGLPAPDAVLVERLAEALIRRRRVTATEISRGIENPDGSVRNVVQFGHSLDLLIIQLCQELALSPRSRAALVWMLRGRQLSSTPTL